MTITISTLGTLGDLLPWLALGRTLESRGHRVTIACSAKLHRHVHASGLAAFPCYPDFGEDEVRGNPQDFDHWPKPGESKPAAPSGTHKQFDLRTRITHLREACRGADLLIANNTISGESIVHELTGIPCLHALVNPERLWGENGHRALLDELDSAAPVTPQAKAFFQWFQRHRLEFGLPETPAGGWRGYYRRKPHLVGASPSLLEPFDTSSWGAIFSGFWFDDQICEEGWEPDVELASFMQQTPAPLVLSFSSQPVADPERIVRVHAEAAAILGYPLLIQSGWAGFSEHHLGTAPRGKLLFRGFLPQDWVFARASAVIHHGGMGTLARALRHGRPMLIEPHGNDQFFNAMTALKNGVGAAMHPGKLRADEVARVLEGKVLSEAAMSSAARLGEVIRSERGLGNAAEAIERFTGWGSHAGPPPCR